MPETTYEVPPVSLYAGNLVPADSEEEAPEPTPEQKADVAAAVAALALAADQTDEIPDLVGE